MKPDEPQPIDDAILEDNLRRLFAVSYLPLAPSASFRERLASAAIDEVARRRMRATRPLLERKSRLTPARFVAAALVLVLLGAGVMQALNYFGDAARITSAEPIVAAGSVAVQSSADLGWRALTAHELEHGFDFPAALASASDRSVEIATPSGSAARLWLGVEGAVELAADSRATIAVQTTGSNFTLERGALSVERHLAGAPWTISACGGNVVLERGRLAAHVADARDFGGVGSCLAVRLERGDAYAELEDGSPLGNTRAPLASKATVAIQDGRVLSTDIAASADSAGHARESIASAIHEPEVTPPDPKTPPIQLRARITGTVRVADGGELPPQFTVTLLRRERASTLAGPRVQVFEATPTFAIEDVKPGGPYEVFVQAPGFAVWRKEPLELKSAAPHTLDVVLERGVTVAGRVVDAATGAPIDGAWIVSEDDIPAQAIPFHEDVGVERASATWLAATRSRSDGTFEIAHLSKSHRRLRATQPGFGAAWIAIGESDVESTLENVEFRLEAGGAIGGRVAHDDGRPWSDAKILAIPLQKGGRMARMSYGVAITDDEARYKIDDLAAGTYVLVNALDARRARVDGPSMQIQVESGKTTTVDLPTKVLGLRVDGTLLAQNGTPQDGLVVSLQPKGQRALGGWRSDRSRDGGRVTFQGIAPGAYDVFVGRGMGSSFAWQTSIDVAEGADAHFDVHLDEASIRGRVLVQNGQTVSGPSFLLLEIERDGRFEFAGRGMADSEGRFHFDRLHPGAYRATVFPMERGLAPTSSGELRLVNADSTLECELSIEPGAALRVKVVDAEGAAVAGVSVTFLDEDGRAMQFTPEDVTDEAGLLPIPGLHPGRWTIGAAHAERHASPVVVELFAGESRDVVIELPR